MTAGVECRLEGNAPNGGMLNRKFYNSADFMLIDPSLNGGHEGDVEPDFCQPVQRPQLLLKDIRFAADDPISLPLKAIELEVERGPHLIELFKEPIVAGDALAVGIKHDKANVAGLRGANEIDDLWMYGRLAAGKLHNFGPALGPHIIVEHLLDFFKCHTEPRRCIGKAQRAIHVAGAVDLDDAKAGMLLMVWAQTAIMRAAAFDFRATRQRNCTGLIVWRERDVGLGVAIHER